MSHIKELINYLNPRKHQGKIIGRGEFHLIKIDEVYINENQNNNSENITKLIKRELPKDYIFNDDFKKLSTAYMLCVDTTESTIKYYFQRNQSGTITYVSLADFLLRDTNETHFHELDDLEFIQIESSNYYYHISQNCIYTAITVLPELGITYKKYLNYNPNHLGGLKNGNYELDYTDATGHTSNFWSQWSKDLFDGGINKDYRERKIKLTLNPQKGKVEWYPKVVKQNNSIILYYEYSIRGNNDFKPSDHKFAIKIEIEYVETFLAFMVVTYFVNGISPMHVIGDIDTRKDNLFVDYVKIINTLLKSSKTNLDQALTYLYYIPADFFRKKQNLFLKMKDPDNILGAQFIWDVIGLGLKNPITNFGTNKEDIILRLLKTLKYIQQDEDTTNTEKNDYILNQLITKKTVDKISYLQALYKKLNTASFVTYNTYIYKLWENSSFINPANPIFKDTSPLPKENNSNTTEDDVKEDKNKPRLVFPYKTNKLLGFYSSNINTSFNDKGNIVITPDESWVDNYIKGINPALGKIVEKFTEEDWQAEYHPLQPIFLLNPYEKKAIQLQKLSPMLLLKANEDKSYWSNVITAGEYALDVVTTASGIGNLAKFRHLARIVKTAKTLNKSSKFKNTYMFYKTVKGSAAAIEITSGTVNALLKITGVKDTEFGAALSKYLFWLELLSLSGELTVAIKAGLKRNAKTLVANPKVLNKHLDDLVKADEIDELDKLKVLDEVYKISDTLFDYSARFAKQVNKSLDNTTQKIKSFEQKIKKYKYEDGKLVNNSKNIEITHSGKKFSNYVDWSYIPNKKFINSILTHNHPSGSGLSLADIKVFLFTELRELRAVTPNNTVFSIKNIKINARKSRELLDFIKKETKSVNNIYGEVDDVFKDALVFRKVWDEMKDLVEYIQYID